VGWWAGGLVGWWAGGLVGWWAGCLLAWLPNTTLKVSFYCLIQKPNSNAIGEKEIMIIASCLAFVALIFLVLLFVWICCRKRSRRIK
jgi:hypothetical protein